MTTKVLLLPTVLVALIVLILFGITSVVDVWSTNTVQELWVSVGIMSLLAFGLFTNWVRHHAATGSWFVRFLEQVRRAMAFENPERPFR